MLSESSCLKYLNMCSNPRTLLLILLETSKTNSITRKEKIFINIIYIVTSQVQQFKVEEFQ